jgi:hypothetical protein
VIFASPDVVKRRIALPSLAVTNHYQLAHKVEIFSEK